MTQYFTYGRLISCTSLADFQRNGDNYHKMDIEWDLPETNLYQYDKIELYRYIGPAGSCINPNNVTETSTYAKIIFKATQNITSAGIPNGTTTIDVYSSNGTVSTSVLNVNIESLIPVTDDFSGLNPNGTELDVYHSLPGVVTNETVINDIGFTRRVLYYILKTYIKGVIDAAPYLLTPDYITRDFTCHSSKTQVRHNYLHYEGDETWCSKEVEAGISPGISRTAVDINRLYLDKNQTGPYGGGGHAWVSDRSTGRIFQHNLRDGYRVKVWNTQGSLPTFSRAPRGFGIGINAANGDCIGCYGDYESTPTTTPTVYKCKIDTNVVQNLGALSSTYKRKAYGIVPLFNYTDRMLITDIGSASNARPAIFNVSTNGVVYSPTGGVGGYAAAACPNGKGIQKVIVSPNDNAFAIISPVDASWFYFTPTGGGILNGNAGRMCVDAYNAYPNTIINNGLGSNLARDYFTIRSWKEFGVHIPSNASSSSECSTIWAIEHVPALISEFTTGGFDGENNLWTVWANSKFKIYRTAHDRNTTDNIDDSVTFPYGSNSRYPAVPLSEWPFSFTSDREIEWFLTRNHGVSTLDLTTFKGSYTQHQLDPSTLDNTVVVNDWYPGLSGTAYQSWWNMVEEKMLRKHHTGIYTSAPYFAVYNTAGAIDPVTRKWGIRMQVSGIRIDEGFSTMNNDLFYETKSDIWLTEIQARIQAWSNAFADSDLSYIGITNRNHLINGNLSGILVHPHYKNATTAVQNYWVEPTLATTNLNQYLALVEYAKNLKYVNLWNMTTDNLYMYSDFTGNILLGAVESSPLNRDTIHPEPTDPVVVLLASAYQSNPGYQDSPSFCYPWKNTIPFSMSSWHNNITGYDDFNVSFLVSANPGSYLLTSFRLSTDDYMPSYLTDINNSSVLTETKNTSYNSANVYQNTALFNYTYHSPSLNGLYYLPSDNGNVYEYTNPTTSKPTGVFNPKTEVRVINPYDYIFASSSCTIINVSSVSEVGVLERWPEPKFFIRAYDDKVVRKNRFNYSDWGYPDRFDKTDNLIKESNSTDAKRYDITYGVDPISASILDRSIARTWPISSWYLNISTNNFRLNWPLSGLSFMLSSNNIISVAQDQQNLFDPISAMLLRYGDYSVTMNVQASTTSTSSDKEFIQYIKISEFEPFANFNAICACTVSPNYSSTDASITGQLIDLSTVHNGAVEIDGITYPFISGYAPNLTVYFKDLSEPHTFPISAYVWNFGDPFNEGPEDVTQLNSNYYTVTDDTASPGDFNGDPVWWVTTNMNHTAVHTYIMPGTYDVTLTVRTSCTNTSDICSKYIETVDDGRKFYIYVEEIPPQCNEGIFISLSSDIGFTNILSAVSGNSPLTAYFMTSGIIAGSFPICRIDWDFGDGTTQKIIRYPLTQTTSQGLPLYNISAYLYDLNDPRNIVVPHIFTNSTAVNQSFDIHISAYACNTNTMIHCSAAELISPLIPEIENEIIDNKKLIGSRFDDDGNLIYIIEGQNDKTTFTVALTGEL